MGGKGALTIPAMGTSDDHDMPEHREPACTKGRKCGRGLMQPAMLCGLQI